MTDGRLYLSRADLVATTLPVRVLHRAGGVLMPASADLTPSQLAVLRAADRSWRTRDALADRARDFHGWAGTFDGLNQTLGSLVRRGLVERSRFSGRVHWQITDKGAAAERSYP